MTAASGICCVDGCAADAFHERTFTVSCDTGGEIETSSWFCCEHTDHFERPPYVDWKVIGVVRPEPEAA